MLTFGLGLDGDTAADLVGDAEAFFAVDFAGDVDEDAPAFLAFGLAEPIDAMVNVFFLSVIYYSLLRTQTLMYTSSSTKSESRSTHYCTGFKNKMQSSAASFSQLCYNPP